MRRKWCTVLLIAILLIMTGCATNAIDTSASDGQTYDESARETGDYTYDDVISSYNEGWDEASEEVFMNHDDLYYDDYQYSIDDYEGCAYGEPYIDESYPDTEYPYTDENIEDAHDQGREAALDEIFCDTDVLCYGEERYYRDDY